LSPGRGRPSRTARLGSPVPGHRKAARGRFRPSRKVAPP